VTDNLNYSLAHEERRGFPSGQDILEKTELSQNQQKTGAADQALLTLYQENQHRAGRGSSRPGRTPMGEEIHTDSE